MPKLIVTRHPYNPTALEDWTRRRRNALSFSTATADLARLLKKKVRGRVAKTSRFFGEAYVASTTRHREAYYGSYKWLTNRRFVGSREFSDLNQEQLRRALHSHFGSKLEKLQQVVRELSSSCHKELRGKVPTAPDLWLVDRQGRHRFIEVKLPGDSVAPHQLAGMAAIACVLGPSNVSVEVIYLHDDDRMFKALCRATRTV